MARSGCIYGPTGSFKSTQVKFFSHYIWEVTGKATALLSLDGGGWGACQPEIDAGIIIPYRCESNVIPLPILRRISQGYWPKDVNETEPSKINLVPMNWEEFGGIAVEGWSSITQVMMRFLPDKNIAVGGENRAALTFRQNVMVNGALSSEAFGSNTRGDYGFAQNTLYGLVMNWNSLPVHYVMYTALESKTEDDDRTTTYGPAIAGKKATAQCGAWVGDMIHAQDYQVVRTIQVPNPAKPTEMMNQDVVGLTCRYYYTKHLDPSTNIPFPAKPRVTPEKLDELYKRFPGGYFEPKPDGKDSFAEYLRTVDKLNAEQAQSGDLQAWRRKMDERLGRKTAAGSSK